MKTSASSSPPSLAVPMAVAVCRRVVVVVVFVSIRNKEKGRMVIFLVCKPSKEVGTTKVTRLSTEMK